ncbi:MAG: MotA/TolQ/ExbB proton channel family protein [Firmicutes bacterium]|nr:MotA/TolQ/ExbB proton channel family protein [Bacillota bacterium]
MFDLFTKGGPVMYPLLLCSVFALAISLERWYYLLRSRIDVDDLLADVKTALLQDRVLEAMQIAKRSRGPVAALVMAGLSQYGKDEKVVETALEDAARQEVYKLERRLPVLDAIVTIAPLLGLLGTVTGIIRSFNVLAALQGLATPSVLSSGIAEALLTTAMGLIIAIPAMAFYAYLSSLVDRRILELNRAATQILSMAVKKETVARRSEVR